jgi:hypothetical protein
MTPLIRTNPKQQGTARSKILLVRPAAGIRSVRESDQPDRAAFKLALGVVVAAGLVLGVWLMGYIGFRLGFAPMIDVPQLQLEPGMGLVTGTLMLISMPRVIIMAGIAQPMWLMLGFVLIAIPAAGISAARPHTPGGPRPTTAAVAFSYTGAIAAAINALVVIWWAASATRKGPLDQLRVDPRETAEWLADLTAVAGIDVLAVIASTTWVVLVLRLAIPLWLRVMASTTAFFTAIVITVAMSMSNAAVTELQKPRSEVFLDDGSVDTRLLLGVTPGRLATLRMDMGVAIVELQDSGGTMTVIGRQSIVSMLKRANDQP